jgi:hypothetical protein
MPHLKANLLALGGLILVLGIGSVLNQRPAAAQGSVIPAAQGSVPAAPVRIVDPLPVPVSGAVTGNVTVSGSVSVTNTPSVNAAQSGTWSVRNVDEPGRAPYQEYRSAQFSSCGSLNCELDFAPVPAGKRLVIRSVSGSVNVSPGTVLVNATLVTEFAKRLVDVPTFFQGNATTSLGNQDWLRFNSFIFAYAEPGSTPHLGVSVSPGQGGSTFASAALAGYYVDIP